MFEAAFQALSVLVDPVRLLFLFTGVFVGIAVGILPGMGGVVGMSILLPFIFGMEPYSALALLIGMVAVTATSDTFPAILFGVPGSSSAVATIEDGYPMSRKGEAARALGAAFSSSLLGGILGGVILFAVLPLARRLVLAIGSPELLMLCLLGITMVGIVSGTRPVRGILAGLLGLLIGSIGAAPAVAEYRYTFEWLYLFDGVSVSVLALGLFALPEIFDLLATKQSVSTERAKIGFTQMVSGIRDTIKNRWLVLRSSAIGVIMGALPGLGGAVGAYIAYGQAKQTSKDSENFGKGDVRGVIAPESANNATEAGTLIPTLLFGVPGSGASAILLSGFTLLGLQAGPTMVTQNMDIVLVIIWSLVLANVLATTLCLFIAPLFARITSISAAKFAPFLIFIIVIAAYQSSRNWGDLIMLFAMGVLGWLMKRLSWSRPALLIGFVLSISVERYMWISWSRYGLGWLANPGVIFIGVLIALVIASSVRRLIRDNAAERAARSHGGAA